MAALAQATAALDQQNVTQSHLRDQLDTLRAENFQLQSRLNGVESSLQSYRMTPGYTVYMTTPLTQATHHPIQLTPVPPTESALKGLAGADHSEDALSVRMSVDIEEDTLRRAEHAVVS